MTDDLGSTLGAVVELLERLGLRYMVVGSIAALAHGLSRATQDFDLVLEVDAARLSALLRALPEERFFVSEEAAFDALRRETLFNIIDLQTGWKVDLIPCKRREFSRVELSRREPLELFGRRVFAATIEDTIVAKLERAKLGGGSSRQLEVGELRLLRHWMSWRGCCPLISCTSIMPRMEVDGTRQRQQHCEIMRPVS